MIDEIDFNTIGLGSHLCSIYHTQEEGLEVIIPFIIATFRKHEKCICVVSPEFKEKILKKFEAIGLILNIFIKTGQMVFLTKEQTYLKDGCFLPEKMIKNLESFQYKSLIEGYHGFRVVGEAMWYNDKLVGCDRLIEYESKVNDFFVGSSSIALCLYHDTEFQEELLLDAIYTHPELFFYGKYIEKNPHFQKLEFPRVEKDPQELSKIYNTIKSELLQTSC